MKNESSRIAKRDLANGLITNQLITKKTKDSKLKSFDELLTLLDTPQSKKNKSLNSQMG